MDMMVYLTDIKLCCTLISKPLLFILNKSLASGIFPERLKYAVFRPIYKKGNKCLISNYIPILLLPVFPKLLEIISYRRLEQHLYVHNILNSEQCGFRRRCCTSDATFQLTKHILNAGNNKFILDVFFVTWTRLLSAFIMRYCYRS